MRMLVTGRDGQVACSLAERGEEVARLGRPQLDLAGETDAIVRAIEAERPDVIVSAAAYTAVDKAESERDLAFAVNQRGAAAVARAANRLGVPLIHLSTDYVFDGSKDDPYTESDPTGPTGVYGQSKLAGEQAVMDAHDDVAVLRTAWVYSPFGGNFVKTMLRLAGDREELGIVADQRGNPTSAIDIADGIITVAANLCGSRDPALRGVFHMTAAGEASWAEFAEEIFAISAAAGGPAASVNPIATADYPTPAKRPANSRLDCDKIGRTHGVALPHWRQSTRAIVQRLVQPATADQGI